MRARSLRILLIDDNKHGLVARRTVLEQLGHTVTVAQGGQEGIDEFASGAFDLVVTDYRMPEVSGQVVIRKIRQQIAQIPIILLSGYVESAGLTEQSTGADVVLSKGPTEVQQLIRAVERLAKRRPPAKASRATTAAAAQPKRRRQAG